MYHPDGSASSPNHCRTRQHSHRRTLLRSESSLATRSSHPEVVRTVIGVDECSLHSHFSFGSRSPPVCSHRPRADTATFRWNSRPMTRRSVSSADHHGHRRQQVSGKSYAMARAACLDNFELARRQGGRIPRYSKPWPSETNQVRSYANSEPKPVFLNVRNSVQRSLFPIATSCDWRLTVRNWELLPGSGSY